VFSAAAEGVTIYACAAHDESFSWVFKAPEAALLMVCARIDTRAAARPASLQCYLQILPGRPIERLPG
jgi:hypothetical protein